MRAGKLRNKIIIESKVDTVNSVGDAIPAWSTFATVWAEIVTQSGREFQNAQQIHSTLNLMLKIRYIDGVLPQMRINNGGRYYNILSSVDPDGRRVMLTVMCDEQL